MRVALGAVSIQFSFIRGKTVRGCIGTAAGILGIPLGIPGIAVGIPGTCVADNSAFTTVRVEVRLEGLRPIII